MRLVLPVSFFFGKLVLWYALFVVLWEVTPVGQWYATAFQNVGTAVFRAFTFGEHGVVWLEPLDQPTELWDSALKIKNRQAKLVGTLPFGTRYWGYASTTMVLSLILATPLAWRRRLVAVVIGMLMVHAWIAGEIWLASVNALSEPNSLAVYTPGPTLKAVLSFVTEIVTKSTVTRYAVSAAIWGLASFRSGDWEALTSFLYGDDTRSAANS